MSETPREELLRLLDPDRTPTDEFVARRTMRRVIELTRVVLSDPVATAAIELAEVSDQLDRYESGLAYADMATERNARIARRSAISKYRKAKALEGGKA